MIELQNKEIKKHVAAIHISNTLTFLQQKIVNVLLLNAYDNLIKNESHSIRIKDLTELIAFESNNQDFLKDSLRGLMSTVLEWNLLDANGKKDGWEGCPILSGVRVQNGWCTYTYSKILREKLYNPDIYARINLAVQARFNSSYSLSLYENCVRFRKIGSSGWISLDIYRKLMGVPEGKYVDFKRLSARVIRDPIKQINSSSDIIIDDPEYKKEKRKVIAIRFTIRDNPQLSLFPLEDKSPKQVYEKNNNKDQKLVESLLEYGISILQIKKITCDHDKLYIQENLEIVNRDYQAGKVKNLPAYTLSALKNDYRIKQSPHEVQQAEQKASKKKKEELKKHAHERLETLQRDFQNNRLNEALDRLSSEELEDLQKRFLQKQEGNQFFSRWMKEGFEHRVVQALFRAFSAEELLPESTEEELSLFAESQGEDLNVLKTAIQ